MNWWRDSGGTIAHGAVPTSSDDCFIEGDETIDGGTLDCNSLYVSANNCMFGASGSPTINCVGTVDFLNSSYMDGGTLNCTALNIENGNFYQGGVPALVVNIGTACTISGTGGINGGTWNNTDAATLYLDGSSAGIGDGIFNIEVSHYAGVISAGTFNEKVYGGNEITGGIFNGPIEGQLLLHGGQFHDTVGVLGVPFQGEFDGCHIYGDVYTDTANFVSGQFDGTVVIANSFPNVTGGYFTHKIALDAYEVLTGYFSGTYFADSCAISWDGGITYRYPVTNSDVAAASDVRDGVFNLGVEGTLGGGTVTLEIG